MSDRKRLRELLDERSAALAPGVFDGLSASLTRSAGFRAAYLSGAAVAATLGLPDIGLATQTEMADRVALLTRVLSSPGALGAPGTSGSPGSSGSLGSSGFSGVPLVADADTGFGDETHVHRTVQLYERAGAAAIQLEDQEFPKRCGHLDNKQVVSAPLFAARIEAAVAARTDPDTVIIARTDARAVLGFDEAVRRVNLYAEAGADMVFLEAPQTAEEIMAVPSAVGVPALFNLVPRGKTPAVSLPQLAEAGYALTILPVMSIGAASSAMRSALARAAAGDVSTEGQDSPHELFDAVGIDSWEALRRP
jgi:2-methylisocitrate lyase-like PEP mutase family enzyme